MVGVVSVVVAQLGQGHRQRVPLHVRGAPPAEARGERPRRARPVAQLHDRHRRAQRRLPRHGGRE